MLPETDCFVALYEVGNDLYFLYGSPGISALLIEWSELSPLISNAHEVWIQFSHLHDRFLSSLYSSADLFVYLSTNAKITMAL